LHFAIVFGEVVGSPVYPEPFTSAGLAAFSLYVVKFGADYFIQHLLLL
jgi:hypothetical protein